MHLLTSIFAYLLPLSCASQEPCKATVETLPWHISWIIVRNTLPSSSKGSSIQFNVNDTNAGLEFSTQCGLTLPAYSGLQLEDVQGWVQCEDERLHFMYEPEKLQLSRSYVDDWYVSLLT